MYDEDGYRALICMTNAPCVMWITMQCEHNWIVLAKWISTLSFIIFPCIIHTYMQSTHKSLTLFCHFIINIIPFPFPACLCHWNLPNKITIPLTMTTSTTALFWYYAVHIMPGGRQGTNFHWSPKKLSIFPSPIFRNFALIYYDKMYASTLPAFLSRKIMIIKK